MSVKKINEMIWDLVDKGDKKRLAKQTFTYDDVVVKKDVSYSKYGKNSLLDIYLPKKHNGNLPIIINVPGGGYTIGQKENNRIQSELFARQGFCVITINYRTIKEESFPTPIKDLFKVFSFVENNFQGDNFNLDNVFLMGDSAGAHITALAGAMANNHLMQYDFEVFSNLKIKGCAFFSSSFQILNLPLVKNGYKKTIYGESIVYDKVTKISDVISKDFPPNIVISPINDFLLFQSLAFNKKCKSLGIENQFLLLKKGKSLGHNSMIKYANHPSYDDMYNQVFNFFKEKLIEKTKVETKTEEKFETKQESKTSKEQNLNKEIEM